MGGLSSSAAVTTAYLMALADVNGIDVPREKLIQYSHWVETAFIGLKNGILDQSGQYLEQRRLFDEDGLRHERLGAHPQESRHARVRGGHRQFGVHQGPDRHRLQQPGGRVQDRGLPAAGARTWRDDALQGHRPPRRVARGMDGAQGFAPGALRAAGQALLYREPAGDRRLRGLEGAATSRPSEGLWWNRARARCTTTSAVPPELITIFDTLKNIPGVHGARFSGGGVQGLLHRDHRSILPRRSGGAHRGSVSRQASAVRRQVQGVLLQDGGRGFLRNALWSGTMKCVNPRGGLRHAHVPAHGEPAQEPARRGGARRSSSISSPRWRKCPRSTRSSLVSNAKFAGQFRDYLRKSGQDDRISLIDDGTWDNEHRLGAVADLGLAIERRQIDDDVLVLAGDNLFDFSLRDFVAYFHTVNADCITTYVEENFEALQRTGVAELDPSDRVLSFEEKPKNPRSNNAVPPFYIYTRATIKIIQHFLHSGKNTDAPGQFVSWLADKQPIYAYKFVGMRYDIGSIAGYEEIKRIFSKY